MKNIFIIFEKSRKMRSALFILIISFTQFICGQEYKKIEGYLEHKYPFSNTISNTKSQYISNSIKPLNDIILGKYLNGVDLYQVTFRTLIGWMPKEYNAILLSDYKSVEDEYYMIYPPELFSSDSAAISSFEKKYIEKQDIEKYCTAFVNLFIKISFFLEPKLNKLQKTPSGNYTISYNIFHGSERTLKIFVFVFDNLYLKEIKILNPQSDNEI